MWHTSPLLASGNCNISEVLEYLMRVYELINNFKSICTCHAFATLMLKRNIRRIIISVLCLYKEVNETMKLCCADDSSRLLLEGLFQNICILLQNIFDNNIILSISQLRSMCFKSNMKDIWLGKAIGRLVSKVLAYNNQGLELFLRGFLDGWFSIVPIGIC
jgi:hypothetical protein